MNIKAIIKNKTALNAGWIIGEQIFQMLVSLIVGVLSARYLGPSNYGTLNYTASFVSFFLSVATLGMEGVVIKKIITSPEKEGDYLGSCICFRLGSSVLSIIAISLIVYVLNPTEPIKLLLVLPQSLQLVFKAGHIFDSWFQRHLKSKYVSMGKMVACVVVSIYKIFLLVTQKSIFWFAFSNSLTDLCIVVLLYAFYKKENGQKLRFKYNLGKEVMSESYHFILSGLMVAIYGQMDKIMLGSMLTDTEVGFYTTATTISNMWIFVPTAIINSLRPTILELKNNGNEHLYLHRLKQLYSGIIYLCVIVSVIVFIMSKFIIRILYGDAFIGAVEILQVAIWFETFSMIGTARGIWILGENKNKYVKYYLFIGAVVNLVLNALMIPFWGGKGAAVATLVTQIVTSIIAPMFFKETKIHTQYVLDAFLFSWYFKKGENK